MQRGAWRRNCMRRPCAATRAKWAGRADRPGQTSLSEAVSALGRRRSPRCHVCELAELMRAAVGCGITWRSQSWQTTRLFTHEMSKGIETLVAAQCAENSVRLATACASQVLCLRNSSRRAEGTATPESNDHCAGTLGKRARRVCAASIAWNSTLRAAAKYYRIFNKCERYGVPYGASVVARSKGFRVCRRRQTSAIRASLGVMCVRHSVATESAASGR